MKLLKLFLPLLVLISNYCIGQNNNDAGLWTGIGVQKEIIKDFDASFEQEIRLHNNLSNVNTVLTQLGTSYRFNKYFTAGLAYRYMQRNSLESGFGARHRWMLNATFRYKFNPFMLSWRVRFQTQNNEPYKDFNERIPTTHIRDKIALKLDLDEPIMPYVGYEIWTALNGTESGTIDNMRFSLGAEFELGKNSELQVGYLNDRETLGTPAVRSHILALGFSFSIPDKKKKKDINVPDNRPSVK